MRSARATPTLLSIALLACAGPADQVDRHDVEDVDDVDDDQATSELGDDDETVDEAPQPCVYPSRVGFARGLAFPAFAWRAVWGDGTEIEFDLESFFCDDEAWGQYDTLIVAVTTVWCPQCPRYIAWLDGLGERLQQERALVLMVDVEDRSSRSVSTADAQAHFVHHAPNGTGIRAGDADNLVEADGLRDSPVVEYFPMGFVLRRSDMVLIADQRDSRELLPFVEIAMDPNGDWSSPPPPTIRPEFPSSCGPDDEEEYEPNDSPDEASTVGVGAIDGGVCGPDADFYRVDVDGPWTATLTFSNAVGDLDMALVDAESGRPLEDANGNAVISQGPNDLERLQHRGSAMLVIYGFEGATAPYRLSITAD